MMMVSSSSRKDNVLLFGYQRNSAPSQSVPVADVIAVTISASLCLIVVRPCGSHLRVVLVVFNVKRSFRTIVNSFLFMALTFVRMLRTRERRSICIIFGPRRRQD